jgi:hypothetical protein
LFERKYSSFGYTLDSSWSNPNEVAILDEALQFAGSSALAKARGLTWDRHGRPTKPEAGEYDPSTHRIGIFSTAFSGGATRIGAAPLAQFTINHELGHALTDLDSGAQAGFVTAAKKDGARDSGGKVVGAVTDYGGTSFEEYFAEAYSMFTFIRGQLRDLRPSIFQFFSARYP